MTESARRQLQISVAESGKGKTGRELYLAIYDEVEVGLAKLGPPEDVPRSGQRLKRKPSKAARDSELMDLELPGGANGAETGEFLDRSTALGHLRRRKRTAAHRVSAIGTQKRRNRMIRITSSVLALTVALSVATPVLAKKVCGNLGPNGWVILDIKPMCKRQKLGKLKLSSVHGAYNNTGSGCRSALTGTCIGDENGVRLSFSTASSTCDDFLVEFSGDDLTQEMSAWFERLQTSDHPVGTTAFTNFTPRDCKEVPFPL